MKRGKMVDITATSRIAARARLISVLAVCLFSSGCAGILHPVVQTYAGSPLPVDQTSFVVIAPSSEVSVKRYFLSVDGQTQNPSGDSFESATALELSPGAHQIVVGMKWVEVEKVFRISRYEEIVEGTQHWLSVATSGEMEAGHDYMLVVRYDAETQSFEAYPQDLAEASFGFTDDRQSNITYAAIRRSWYECKEILNDRCTQCTTELHTVGSKHYEDQEWFDGCAMRARKVFTLCAKLKMREALQRSMRSW